MDKRVHILGVSIDNYTKQELIEAIDNLVRIGKPSHIVGVNVDQVLHTHKFEIARKIFNEAAIVFTDGKPIIWMSKILGNKILERTTGPDLMDDLCALAARKRYRIFLLGAAEGVAAKAAIILKEKYPDIYIAGTYSPPMGFQNNTSEIEKINSMLRNSNSDMLFVGMGSPKQDIFIYQNMNKYQVPVSFSMGAAIDFIAGNIRRAPRWMIDCGLEWFYRVLQDPRRLWKRYFIYSWKIIPIFISSLLKK